MTFKVIDKKTGKEPTSRVIDNIAKKGGLMIMDIDQFFVGEDGELALADDCGNITYCDTKRFEVIVDQEPKTGQWIKNTRGDYCLVCSECGYGFPTSGYAWLDCNRRSDERETASHITDIKKFCPNCGCRMSGSEEQDAP